MEIKVHVVRFADRKNLVLRYTDPVTGKRHHKSARTDVPSKADRAAARWEDELKSGTFKPAAAISWSDFRDLFESKYLRSKSQAYWTTFQAVFNHLEDIRQVARLRDVPAVLTDYVDGLRDRELSENTIQGYMKYMRVALYWAADEGHLAEKPNIRIPDGTDDQMKGRPLEPAEFASMLLAVDEVIPEHAECWKHYLNGLWLSGLRRTESLALSWDSEQPFHIDRTGLYWQFRIRASAQKNKKSQFCPMAPDFVEWLQQQTEASERVGHVFNPVGFKGQRLTSDAAGRMVSEFGRVAQVETDPENEKFATCHDLRRSFGERWARQLMPADLMKLMRHRSIETTLKHYLSKEADELSARLQSTYRTAREVTDSVTV